MQTLCKHVSCSIMPPHGKLGAVLTVTIIDHWCCLFLLHSSKYPPVYPVHTYRNMKAVDIDTMSWEGLASDRTKWRSALKQHLKTGEDKVMAAAADTLARRKEGSSSIRQETTHICDVCNKDCHSHIDIFSHKRRCLNPARN